MRISRLFKSALLLLATFAIASCGGNDEPNEPNSNKDPETSANVIAKGADVSWVTEMEAKGIKFYDANGKEQECMALMKSLGMNAIRLRVWVNPANGWCGKDDVVRKAVRAKNLGMDVMIDFHYSDNWADPGQQIKPAAWKNLSLAELKKAIADHTTEVLTAVKNAGVTPKWVQVGNEIRSGMLWDTDAALSGATWDAEKDGIKYKTNQKNFVEFINAGSAAVRKVLPNALVIVHTDNGAKSGDTSWICDILKNNKADYDVIGLSFYPAVAYNSELSAFTSNVKSLISTYGKKVMLCEVGMPANEGAKCKALLTQIISFMHDTDGCLGVFYWEPECYGKFNSYGLGAFTYEGRPTEALDAFKN